MGLCTKRTKKPPILLMGIFSSSTQLRELSTGSIMTNTENNSNMANPTPNAIPILTDEQRKRFLSHQLLTDNGCVLWNGPRGATYGFFWINKRRYSAHRVSLSLAKGNLGLGNDKVCHHKCRNKLCVNPFHLEEMTNQEHSLKHGHEDRVHYSKITPEQAEQIKIRLSKGEEQRLIAKDFGISPNTISKIRLGQQWADIRPDLTHRKNRQHGTGGYYRTKYGRYQAMIKGTYLGSYKTTQEAERSISAFIASGKTPTRKISRRP